MADPVGIIGLSGTVQQLVELTKFLIDSYKALKKNTPAAKELLDTYEQLQSLLSAISLDSFQGANHTHLETVKHELGTIKELLQEAQNAVQRKGNRSENRALQFVSALSDEAEIEKLTSDADKIRQCIYKLSSDQNLIWLLNRTSTTAGDKFCATILAEKNPTSVYIDLNAKDEHGQPNTCESRLRELIFRDGRDTHVGPIAIGQGGVGKTCTLRAIANDPHVLNRFPGGAYFFSLGKDASIGTIIQKLCEAVKASGGRKLATQLEAKDNLSSVVAGVQNWFKSNASLFIFDDVWTRKDIDGKVLQTLSRLVNDLCGDGSRRGRILYSTRDDKLSLFGQKIKFEARARQGARSLEILLHVAGEKSITWEDPESQEHIRTVLERCAGLPLALNVAGSSVRLMRENWTGDPKEAWKKYSEKVNEPDTFVRQDPGDGYDSLNTMLYSSLQILDDSKKESECFSMTFQEMHRGLCTLKKQDWLPLSILQYLWGTVDERTAERIVMQLQRVGVAELQYQGGFGGVRLHDLTHDFATLEAKKHEEVEKWHKKLVDKYRTDDGLISYTLPSSIHEGEKRYVFENVYRVCQKAGMYEEIIRLLQSARWVTSVLEHRAFLQLEEAVKDLTELETQSSDDFVQEEPSLNELDEDCRFGLRMIAKAVRLSVSYLEGNVRNLFFQLYGRLMEVSSKSAFVRRFLKDLEECAPRPWLKAITNCLTGADGAILEAIKFEFPVEKVRFSSDGIIGSGFIHGSLEVHVFKQNLSKELTVLKSMVEATSVVLSTQESESVSTTTTGLRNREQEMMEGQGPKNKTLRRLLHHLHANVQNIRWCCRGDDEQRSERRSEQGSEPAPEQNSEQNSEQNFEISCVDVYEDLVAAGCSDGSIRITRLSTNSIVCTIKEHTGGITSICFSADGKRVVSGSTDKTVRVWEVATGAPLCKALEGHSEWVSSVAISRDGKRVVSGSEDNTVRVWEVATGAPLCKALDGHSDWVRNVAISEDGKRVVSGSSDKTVRVWEVGSGAPFCKVLEGHSDVVLSVAISEDGKRVVSGSTDKTVRVWEVGSGAPLCKALERHSDWVSSVAISGDGKRVVSGSGDGTVRVWEVGTGAPSCKALEGQSDWVRSVAISGDGKRVMEALEGHSGFVRSVAISGDGKRVVSGFGDNTVRVWEVATGDCLLVSDMFTWDEIIACYCGIGTQHGTSCDIEDEHNFVKGDSIVMRSRNGSEEVLAHFDTEILSYVRRNGVVVVGFYSGAVAILKIIK